MIVLIGAGNIGRELLSKLSRDFEIVCVDSNPGTRPLVEALRGSDRTRVIIGDATSRLVLEEARVDESDAVIITTTSEKINKEVARVLHDHFHCRKVISAGITHEGMQELAGLGAEVKNIFTATANDIRNLIEHQAKTAYGIGIGKNEILEVEVHPNSKLKNRPLGWIAPIRWNIGIIYREGNIIIPRADTVLKERDRVIIFGDPSVLRIVAEMMTSDFQRFPLEFGTSLFVYVSGAEGSAFFEEVNYVYSVFQLEKVHFIYASGATDLISRHEETVGRYKFKTAERTVSSFGPAGAVTALLSSEPVRPGIVILSKKTVLRASFGGYTRSGKKTIDSLVRAGRCPVILAEGSFPYGEMAVPALQKGDFRDILQSAVEISMTANTNVEALLVKPSEYISAEEEHQSFEEMKGVISNIGFFHKKKIPIRILEGNPVQGISRILPEYNLLVLNAGHWAEKGLMRSLLSPNIEWQILRRSMISVLALPGIEESL